MALSLTVKKQDNPLFIEFIDAYWCVENINFSTIDKQMYVSFNLNTYPSREARYKNLYPIEQTGEIPIGGASKIAYDTTLRRWEATFRAIDIFPEGIPMTEDEQKLILYEWIKDYTKLPFIDVFEDEEESEDLQ